MLFPIVTFCGVFADVLVGAHYQSVQINTSTEMLFYVANQELRDNPHMMLLLMQDRRVTWCSTNFSCQSG
jgi:hypothetical protein